MSFDPLWKVLLLSFTTKLSLCNILPLFHTSPPIPCPLIHLPQLPHQCPTLDPSRRLPSRSLRLHPTDQYNHSFMASHCSQALSADGCTFHSPPLSPVMPSQHHLSSTKRPIPHPSWQVEMLHPLCTTWASRSFPPFSESLPQGGCIHHSLPPPSFSRSKACFCGGF